MNNQPKSTSTETNKDLEHLVVDLSSQNSTIEVLMTAAIANSNADPRNLRMMNTTNTFLHKKK